RHFDGDRYELSAWVVMPNHVHAVVRPLGDRSLSKVLQGWKSYTATVLNRLLARPGRPFWQTESYDHLIRDDADRERCCHYTVMNPVNAGLCARPEDWRWSSAYCPPP
ncbi:MAG: REP-associated tyrosine transposase, partial [Limisphaerales bacterium]